MADAREPMELFPREVDAIAVNLWFVPGRGWRLSIAAKREGETFHQGRQEKYEDLTLQEALQVLDADVSSLTRLPSRP